MWKNKNVLFQLSGSIACYKACDLLSKLVQLGAKVQVVASESAMNFVGEATLEGLSGNSVATQVFETNAMMDHIHLSKWANMVVLCPATANKINELSQGLGRDLIGNLFLAHDFAKPYFIVPAMNTKMYENSITQKSIETLKNMRVQVLKTNSGNLACGDTGLGKMLEPTEIISCIEESIQAYEESAVENSH